MHDINKHTCKSFIGFQSCSMKMTVSAPVRFKPSPPTCVVSNRTSIDGSLLNLGEQCTEKSKYESIPTQMSHNMHKHRGCVFGYWERGDFTAWIIHALAFSRLNAQPTSTQCVQWAVFVTVSFSLPATLHLPSITLWKSKASVYKTTNALKLLTSTNNDEVWNIQNRKPY